MVLLYVSMETVPRGKAVAPEATHELMELSHTVPTPQLSGPALATIPKLTRTFKRFATRGLEKKILWFSVYRDEFFGDDFLAFDLR